ncbi:MAG: phage minor head protein [Smithella sp.]
MTPERMQLEAVNALAKKLSVYESQVSKALYDALQTMRADMSKLYEKYATNGILTKADMTRYNRYASMEKQMLTALDPAIKANLKVIKRLTPEMYNESFFREAWQIDSASELRLNWGTINKGAIVEDLANPYDKIAYENYPRNAKQAIRKAINNGLPLGKTLTQMTRDLKKAMNITNAAGIRIVRTEAMTAQNAAANDVYTRAIDRGIEGDDIWDATFDLKTRPDHGHADGQVKNKKTGMFSLGGELTPYPGWENLSAKQRINCRCHHRFQISGYSPKLIRTREQGVIPFQTYDEWKKNYPIKVK